MIGGGTLVGKSYERTDILFTIDGDQMVIEPFELIGETLRLGGSGIVDLSGPVDLELTARVPRAGIEIKQIPSELLDGLTDGEGFTTLGLIVGGTLQEPDVGLDTDALKAGAKRGARIAVEEALGDAKDRARESARERLRDRKKKDG